MNATNVLKEEHQAILRALRVLDTISAQVEAGKPLPVEDLDRIVEFIRVFADRCHHGKEEDLLFVEMERAGIPRQRGPLGVMLAEHQYGRDYVKGMAQALEAYKAGDKRAAAEVARNARGYTSLLAQHIDKEDNILYPMAEQCLAPAKDAELMREFERVEQERIGPGRHEAFHALLDRLEKTYLS
jgi:hemerythrin-like domain-containing protein